MASKVQVAEPGPTPAHVTVEMRGRRFTFTELEISEYNKLLKQATHEEVDDNGETVELTDNTLLMQLMVVKSSQPKLTPDEVAGMGTRMYRQIARIVNELHYGDEPVKLIGDEGEGVDDLDAKEETEQGKD